MLTMLVRPSQNNFCRLSVALALLAPLPVLSYAGKKPIRHWIVGTWKPAPKSRQPKPLTTITTSKMVFNADGTCSLFSNSDQGKQIFRGDYSIVDRNHINVDFLQGSTGKRRPGLQRIKFRNGYMTMGGKESPSNWLRVK
jgi:hypothetical protein